MCPSVPTVGPEWDRFDTSTMSVHLRPKSTNRYSMKANWNTGRVSRKEARISAATGEGSVTTERRRCCITTIAGQGSSR